ncbi:LytR/AlgR family response regulator transcription factor [Formosa algae]|uniref:DNA-binding LytR/AlgR family response regulator n=1 Tax=Formosa algae TaxID=225843 RepID=A0A9X1C8X8_9FLAO|nr:LytTR family DNA-binding domain-containing protein [Formosa algae]MBP1840121.1 DNA-binding LytR/AlgR family response regulator [Formosa algae]MDQ0335721.1 DNA-binding LytR/AlgR family response regulator [Formosa algae]OEI79761.1 DNA-binding response regulator [Formosa algae]PNW29715.1 DNA-binding response regulator [Formosa algae]
MITCIAVDDEPLALRQIVSYIEQTPFLELKGKFTNALSVSSFLNEHAVDLIFLDIHMADLNGLELAKTLVNPPKIIFTTAYSEYAVEGYKVNAIDYLLKPIEYVNFLQASNKASDLILQTRLTDGEIKKKDEFLFIKSGQQHIRINFKDIKYIESQKEYISIHLTHGESVKTLFRLKNIEDILPKAHFMRIHRSFIVNLNHIVTVERNRIIYSRQEFIVVSETYQDEFKTFLNNNFFN